MKDKSIAKLKESAQPGEAQQADEYPVPLTPVFRIESAQTVRAKDIKGQFFVSALEIVQWFAFTYGRSDERSLLRLTTKAAALISDVPTGVSYVISVGTLTYRVVLHTDIRGHYFEIVSLSQAVVKEVSE